MRTLSQIRKEMLSKMNQEEANEIRESIAKKERESKQKLNDLFNEIDLLTAEAISSLKSKGLLRK